MFDATHGIDVLNIARPEKGALSAPHVACQTRACRDENKLEAQRAKVLKRWRTQAPTVGQRRKPFGFACRLGLADVVGGLGALKVR